MRDAKNSLNQSEDTEQRKNNQKKRAVIEEFLEGTEFLNRNKAIIDEFLEVKEFLDRNYCTL